MPKVVSGKGFDEFVQTGKHQTIDEPKKGSQAPKVEPAKEVKELVQKAEAETAKDMEKPQEKEETGLEAGDEELAERAQQRISKKHREMKAAEALAKKLKDELDETETFSKTQYQRAVAAEDEAAKLREQLKGQQPPPAQAEKTGIKPPDEKDPKFYVDGQFQLKVYEAARDEYVKAQFREELKAEQAEAEWQTKLRAFEGRLEKARAEHSDFNEVVGSQNIEVLPFVQRFMVDSDMGAEIGYYFGKNPDELKRIQALHVIRASGELGKLEAKLDAAKAKPEVKDIPAPKPAVTPPAPISPLSGQGSPGINSDPAKMTPKELLAYTREREVARKRGRFQ